MSNYLLGNDPAHRDKIKVARLAEICTTKLCTKCWLVKPLDDFYKDSSGVKGVHAYCKLCTDILQRTRYTTGPGRNNRLQRLFGLTLLEYDQMLRQQNGCCAICGRSNPGRKCCRFLVDHNHTTGKVRGLLCHRCNTALGMMDDDPERLSIAINYLRKE